MVDKMSKKPTYDELEKRILELERSKSELELNFKRAQKISRIGSWDWDPLTDKVTYSDTILEIFGLKKIDFGGDFASILDDAVHPDDKKIVQEAATNAQSTGVGSDVTYRIIRPDGELRWIHSLGEFVFEDGQLIKMIGTNQDITDQKLAEQALIKSEEQVRRAQKMEAIGELTGGIAHDFNNILSIAMGYLELIQNQVSQDDKLKTWVESALTGVRRGANLTNKLLGFARKDADDEQLVSVNELVNEMENLIAKSLTVSINTKISLTENLWPVRIEPGDLEDAILNLSLNARDAMPDGGKLTIKTSNKVFDEKSVSDNSQGLVGEFVMISVSDTGCGMTQEICENVFEPFFSTKEKGKGTGLGLSMVYGFVRRSGGHVKAYSEVDKGTTVTIFIPRAREESADEVNTRLSLDLPQGNETILVVDDEKAILDIVVIYLEELGYQTVTAQNSKQALKILGEHNNIELLFSDVVMPDMNGYQLSLAAHKLYPSLKILLTSGFSSNSEKLVPENDMFIKRLTSNILTKPFNMRTLATAVRNALDELL